MKSESGREERKKREREREREEEGKKERKQIHGERKKVLKKDFEWGEIERERRK